MTPATATRSSTGLRSARGYRRSCLAGSSGVWAPEAVWNKLNRHPRQDARAKVPHARRHTELVSVTVGRLPSRHKYLTGEPQHSNHSPG